MLPAADAKEVMLDIACCKSNEPFRGDAYGAQSVKISLHDFLDLMDAADSHEASRMQWALGIGLQYYMAQCPILSKEEGVPAILSCLAKHMPVPSFAAGRDVAQVNLWMSVQQTMTNTHYDANDNVLLVVRGHKRVRLWPPSEAHTLEALAVWKESPNHSPHVQDVGGYNTAVEQHVLCTTLEAGEGLFLPEGWWHQVDSEGGTVAINLWFRGFGYAISKCPDHMFVYLLRSLAHEMLSSRKKRIALDVSRNTRRSIPSQVCLQKLRFSLRHFNERRVNAIMNRMDVPTMKDVLPALSFIEWRQTADALSPNTVEHIMTLWEEEATHELSENQGEMQLFYESLFADDSDGSVRSVLLKKREQHSYGLLRAIIQDTSIM